MSDVYQIELLKLMARRAAADGEVAPAEVETIIRAGRRAGGGDAEMEALKVLDEALAGGA